VEQRLAGQRVAVAVAATRGRWSSGAAARSSSNYLTLLMTEAEAGTLVDALRGAATVHRTAKDILRASGLALLPEADTHVAADLDKVRNGEKLSPILLVRGRHLLVADGYHRVCAAYWLDENTDIPCRLV
jgi:hypothetical protein